MLQIDNVGRLIKADQRKDVKAPGSRRGRYSIDRLGKVQRGDVSAEARRQSTGR